LKQIRIHVRSVSLGIIVIITDAQNVRNVHIRGQQEKKGQRNAAPLASTSIRFGCM
jgi:hypothetical protein